MTTPSHPIPGTERRTEIKVAGANCPWCLNAAIEILRQVHGVRSVHSSMTEECIQVVHEDVPIDTLLDSLRSILRGVEGSSYESQMVPVDPQPAVLRCGHATASAGTGPVT